MVSAIAARAPARRLLLSWFVVDVDTTRHGAADDLTLFAASPLLMVCLLLTACGARSGLGPYDPPEDTPAPVDGGLESTVSPDAGIDSSLGDGSVETGPTGPAGPGEPEPGEEPEPRRTESCVELPMGGPPAELQIAHRERADAADVMVLFDATASMDFKIDGLRYEFPRTLLPAVTHTARDLRVGFASFQDFDLPPTMAPPLPMPGPEVPGTYAFRVDAPLGSDPAAVQRALDELELTSTSDWPESQVEALYQLATGEGNGTWVPRGPSCPAGHGGYVCFRERLTPVVLLFTDAQFHLGPRGLYPYPTDEWGRPRAPSHDYEQAVAALRARNIRVAGFWSGIDPRGQADLRALARDTGAVDAHGEPIVVDLNHPGTMTRDALTDVIRRLFDEEPMDVSLELSDLGGDDGDARALIESIETLPPSPFDGARTFEDRYEDVWMGTRVGFALTLRNERLEPGPRTLRFRLRLRMVGRQPSGTGSEHLVERSWDLVIPGLDGGGCER